jgi:hypothetical protein
MNRARVTIPYVEFQQETYMVAVESIVFNFGIPNTGGNTFIAPMALQLQTRGLCRQRYNQDGSTDAMSMFRVYKVGNAPEAVVDVATTISGTVCTVKKSFYGMPVDLTCLGDVICNNNLTFEFFWEIDVSPTNNGAYIPPAVPINGVAGPLAPTAAITLVFYPNPFVGDE